MLDRRHFLSTMGAAGLTCACGRPGLAQQALAPVVAPRHGWFLCSTPQITELVTIAPASSGQPGGVTIQDGANVIDATSPVFMPGAPGQIDEYATAQRALRWRRADGIPSAGNTIVLGIAFLDGDAWQRGAVESHAREWLNNGIGLDFVFNNPSRRHIRITFNTSENKSKIGREDRNFGSAAPTMHLAGVNRSSTEEVVRRVVLHEFGHGAMTMGHEHKHPDAGFEWDIAQIEADTGWSRQKIRTNITSVYDRTRVCAGAPDYDMNSIMHYPMERSWIRNAGVAVERLNSRLSDGDIRCARHVYSNL